MHPRKLWAEKKNREIAKRAIQLVLFNKVIRKRETTSAEIQKEVNLSKQNFYSYMNNKLFLKELESHGIEYKKGKNITYFFIPEHIAKKLQITGGLNQEEGK